MYVAYLLIVTMNAGAGELVDPKLHTNLESCEAELATMKEIARRDLAVHNIIKMQGSCRKDLVDQLEPDPIQFAEFPDY